MRKSREYLKQKADRVTEILEREYPVAECALEYNGEPWKLLIMGRLSAQCTDIRVNAVSKELFVKYPTLQSFADSDITELEQAVKSCGLYHSKAKDIKRSCQMLIEKFGGTLPDNMDDLLLLPGVGRKIANLLLGDIFGKPAVVADTHCIRISSRLGFTPMDEKDPYKTETALKKVLDESKSSDFCHRLVLFGREVCSARKPLCGSCPLTELCDFYEKENKK